MNTIKLSLSFILILLISFSNFAQEYSESNNQFNSSNNTQDLQSYTTRAVIYEPKYNTNGTPYENEDFVMGSLLGENNVLVSNVVLRYNAVRDEFQVKKSLNKNDNNILAVIKKTDLFVKMGTDVFTFVLTADDGVKGYFNILLEGNKLSVYKKISKKYQEGEKPINSMKSNTPNRFIDDVKYYLVNEDKEFMELPNSKSKRIKLISSDNRKELKKFSKTENLNIKKEEDLIKLVEYYNQNF